MLRHLRTTYDTQHATRRQAIVVRKTVAKTTRERAALHTALAEWILARDFVGMATLLDDGAFAEYEPRRGGRP